MADTLDFLLEIGTEEMPSAPLINASKQLPKLVVKMLDEVDGYEIKGEELKFYDDKKLLAEFRAVQDAAAQKK